MLLPLFILAIGMLYYRLAKKHQKPAWGYAFLGIGVFIGTPVIVGLILWLIASAVGASGDIEFTIALWAIRSETCLGLCVFGNWRFYRHTCNCGFDLVVDCFCSRSIGRY